MVAENLLNTAAIFAISTLLQVIFRETCEDSVLNKFTIIVQMNQSIVVGIQASSACIHNKEQSFDEHV